MAAAAEGYTLEKFARHPFYMDVNRRLVKLADLRKGAKVVDLGAGTGAVTRLLAEAISNGSGAEVIAVEPSDSAIEVARRNLENIRGAVVRFVQGGAERLSSLVKRQVDAVFFCNAIHLVPEKDRVMHEINLTLRPDGKFSFNTTFYEGGEPEDAEVFYRRWMMKALRILKKEYGLTPDLSMARTMARNRLSEADYMKLLKNNGFKVSRKEVMKAEMSLESFEDISEYALWIEGILPGVPLEVGSHALKQGVREVFQDMGISKSQRNWLLVVANKQ
ncbi:MAG TPA: class I SAM-dependent methyltransferase [Dehalococcoidia bacterium]|nr:class I SAM-dependent methyltransferase [Dehalococcoidia bacterium]